MTPRFPRAALDWLEDRTGCRALLRRLREEPLPAGAGWWFVTGSVLLFLLVVQLATGIVLAMYYVPAPQLAYDSVRFVSDALPFGGIVRGLHVFGASFIVVAAVVHMVRVVLLGSYKKPREVTWLTGVALLLVILAFALTGYLLPWDQKAYWATTVTVNIAASAPGIGEYVAGVLRGGPQLGALALGRWYAAHVLLLPIALAALVAAHLVLMRRHGVSGPLAPRTGPRLPFYPFHVLKEALVASAVFAALLALALRVPAPLDAIADPSDATYVPRPEWYFMSLFQLLKYFPGPFEPIATLVIPALIVGGLFLLPFLDRTPDRHPARRPAVIGAFAALGLGVAGLTLLGLGETPVRPDPRAFTLRVLGGMQLAELLSCGRCHAAGGVASPIPETRVTRDPEWVLGHVSDPEVIGPGVRPAPEEGPTVLDGRAILAYMAALRAGGTPPATTAEEKQAAVVWARICVACHTIDGDGGSEGPDLSAIGRTHDAAWLRRWIADPTAIKPDAEMPALGKRLAEEELNAIAAYLAGRR